jgi:hypothetical protein
MFCHGSNLPCIQIASFIKGHDHTDKDPRRGKSGSEAWEIRIRGVGNLDPTKFGFRSAPLEAWHSRTEQQKMLKGISHGGNTEEENNDKVVFELNIHTSAGKKGAGEGEALLHPPSPLSTAEPEFLNF